MSLLDLVAAIRRRWYVVVVGLLVTGFLGWAATLLSPPVYTARGLVILLPPAESTKDGGNPFLLMSGLDLPAGILVAYYSSETAQKAVADIEPTATYDVQVEASTRGPIVSIDVTDKTADGTLATLKFVADDIPKQLARLQQQVDAPQDAVVTSMPLTMDGEAQPDTSGTTRMLILAVGLGLVLTAVVLYASDGVLRRARTARRGSSVPIGHQRPRSTDGGSILAAEAVRGDARRPDTGVPANTPLMRDSGGVREPRY